MAPKTVKSSKVTLINEPKQTKQKVAATSESSAYKKRSLYEHVLKEPDMFMGSIVPAPETMWVYDSVTDKFCYKNVVFPPGLYKINDELYVNARDHVVRDGTCTAISVDIDKKTNKIVVYNNGNGIPVVYNEEHQVYIPELIFSQLLTSSNYDKTKKITGGKNGLGAKLTNIYSKEFVIETVDSNNNLKYVQRFSNNMLVIDPPNITKTTPKTLPYTKITFVPDLQKFGLTELTFDLVSLLEKRVYDLAACTHENVSVSLNGKQLKIKTFRDYISMYYQKMPSEMVYEDINDRWSVAVVFDPPNGYRQVSFVNGVCTYQGGTHVNYIVDQICRHVILALKKKKGCKNEEFKPLYIKDNITVFVNAVIEDPGFKSQTKEELTTKPSLFGSTAELSPIFIKKLLKTGIVEAALNLADAKNVGCLAKTDAKKTNSVKSIAKLDDALLAGTKKSSECNLILTEGDSAKVFAIAGLDVIGRERYGVFPLRGKLLNVREASGKQIINNEEFKNLKQILGLKQKVVYNDTKKLRYGGIIILTDQDVDGSHIKGLIINMFETFWPSLLQIDGFIKCMTTPIIKVFKKNDTKKSNPLKFYTIADYENWKNDTANGDTSKYIIKYYKGLGTSDTKEAKTEFLDFNERLMNFIWEKNIQGGGKNLEVQRCDETIDDEIENDDDTNDNNDIDDNEEIITETLGNHLNSKSHDAITLAFAASRADDRKKWLQSYDKTKILDMNSNVVTFSDFINYELIQFSVEDNERSIPSVIDGFKPSLRKILYGCFLNKIENKEMRVAQLGAAISRDTVYHHGEASLYGAIISMAQNFVGSNNINLLLPNGNFGTRRMGGKDAASPRYINTQLNKLTGYIFRREDEPLYKYVEDSGEMVEPVYYVPILPFVLINGTEGIGTGFSTSIPPHNPVDIVESVKAVIKGEELPDLVPWYKGFNGTIEIDPNFSRINIMGKYEIIDDKTVKITELPIGKWTENYKIFLDSMLSDSKTPVGTKVSKNKIIESYINNSGINKIEFIITFIDGALQDLYKNDTIEKILGLSTKEPMSNMYLHDANGVIKKYGDMEDIIREFCQVRYELYKTRHEYYLKILDNDLLLISSKVRFIEMVIDRTLIIEKRSEKAIILDLKKHNFPELTINIENDKPSYRYLTDMKLFSLSSDKLEELKIELDKKQKERDLYAALKPKDIWIKELDEFLAEYNKWIIIQNDEEEEDLNILKNKGKKTIVVKGKQSKQTKSLQKN